MILRNPQALLLLALLPAFVALWRWRRGRASLPVLGLRLGMVALVVLALADPIVAQQATSRGTLVVLADQSASLGAEGQAALRARAEQVLAQNSSGYQAAHLVLFGKNQAADSADTTALDGEATDIAAALEAARGLITPGTGRVILLSDGGQNRGNSVQAAQALGAAGIPIDTLAYAASSGIEAWVGRVDMPATLRVGEEFSVVVTLGSTGQGNGDLQLSDGNRVLAAQAVALAPGQQQVAFTTRANAEGVLRLVAQLQATPDTEARNNQAAATALVAPPPNVLLVEGRNGGAAPLRLGLRNAGVESSVTTAAALPSQLSALDAFDGVVLIDVPAGDMTLDQMSVLREFVRSEGRGLVATGGRSSFTLGAYKGTPLEEVLPVQMDPPPRPQRGDIAMLLVIDRSASMNGTSPSKFDMAKEAALLATESLRDEDRLGVLAFDTGTQWTVPFQQVGIGLSLAQVQEQIGGLTMGGGTDILQALQVGLSQLAQQPSSVRHAVLLTDGRSFSNEYPLYRMLVEQARQYDITLSAIAIGSDSDTELLQNLADWGAGRYHFAAEPDDIPRLTMLESDIARNELQIEGDFRANEPAAHPMLRDFPAQSIPNLGGYVATTLKPQAEMVLSSPDEDPILSVWQYGLGRAVAWTPSVEAPWAPNWSNWPEYGEFWAQIIRYTLPEPDSGLTQARATARGDEVVISVDSLEPGGTTFDLADTLANITLPDGSQQQITLRQTAPGRYSESLVLPADGAYSISITQRKNAERRDVQLGYVQAYPAEYLPVQAGDLLLARLSEASGGRSLGALDETAPAPERQPAQQEPFGLAPWLLLAAALLWPFEIAARRGWFRILT